MPAIYEHCHTVGDDEIDSVGHVNNLAYVEWLLAAALAHTAAQGWPSDRYLQAGAGWVVRSHHIEYLQPAMPGDRILVRTWVATMKKTTSLRRYRIVRVADETLLATAETRWAYIDFQTRQPLRIPPEVAGSFQVVDQ